MLTKAIHTILIANRGEIALRVIRSAKEMGIRTVAIYSDVDKNMPFVKLADLAVGIGGQSSKESYLDMDKVMKVCLEQKVDAVHPGYGFLSENPVFAERLEKEGIRLIGPSSYSMKIMGDKLSSKEAVKKFDVPVIPGSAGAVTHYNEVKEIAKKTGYPVLIKASAGGGGKGMRVVNSDDELESAFERATGEAEASFGNGAVFVEKYVINPKHIEFQIMADMHGSVVHLFERDCSVQRRHQKVVEEAPSMVLDEALRKKMGECAVNVAKACNYVGAGTVEFMLDSDKNFYFLEMNTRLQVEHPVTEMITGLDLVKEQIKVARGEKLSFSQEDLKINGHAIEVRVCAEDVANDFAPDNGIIKYYNTPKGLGIRVDDGFEQGGEVSMFYDSMIAKLIVHGKTREEAIAKMQSAISQYTIVGVKTTLNFAQFVLKHEEFLNGSYGTSFIANNFKKEDLLDGKNNEAVALLAAWLQSRNKSDVKKYASLTYQKAWKQRIKE
ncbi:MAG: acetyl-CoA carboxylase biotin carboxylase subunit [Bacteroidetes bacterium]|nr:acetyl-CoA carboxylase biotin carboxylase subunit [Bacteroidota bacterium]